MPIVIPQPTPEITSKYTIQNGKLSLAKIINPVLDRDENGRFVKGCIPKYTQGMKDKKHSEITKKKMSKNNGRYWQGKHFSKEHLEKLSKFQKERFKKNSVWNKGKSVLEETRIKISEAMRGRRFTKEHRMKIGESQKGKNGNNWRGGITPENIKIRNGIEFGLWRESVFARDNWTCQKYGIKGGKLHAHHIQNFAQYPELRFAINNGITLSKKAHKEFHKIYGTKNNTKEQLEEFLCQNYQQ